MRHTVFIFDLDGVLVDTASLHYSAWRRLAHELGFELTITDNERLKGVSRDESLSIVLSIGGIECDLAERHALATRKNTWYVESLAGLTPQAALPGAIDFVRAAQQAGIKIALASASCNAARIIKALGIESLFDTVVDGTCGLAAKPDPAVFLEAARRLGEVPANCIVFEDAASGIEAALRGGFRVVGIGQPENLNEADLLISSFEGLSIAALEQRLDCAGSFSERRAWLVTERTLDCSSTAAHETRYAQANGVFALRGCSPFGSAASPGCLVAGAFDSCGSAVIELAILPDPSMIKLYLDYEPIDVSSAGLKNYQRSLDMQRGLVIAQCSYRSRTGAELDVRCERLVSASDPELWAEKWTVRAGNFSRRIIAVSTIEGGLRNSKDHPVDAAKHFSVVHAADSGNGLELIATLSETGEPIIFTSAVIIPTDTIVTSMRVALRVEAEKIEEALAMELIEGKECCFYRFGMVVKSATTGLSSAEFSAHLLAVQERLAATIRRGYEAAARDHQLVWATRWQQADVRIHGDLEACRALRFNLFHLMQAVSPNNEKVSIGAKGLHGEGYKGHVFWDTETFMLPFFTYTAPEAARRLLSYRWHTLKGARANAAAGGYRGARFAWESAVDGAETTPRWGVDYAGNAVRIWTGDEEVHIGADIAHAVLEYYTASADETFMIERGLELIFSVAEFMESLAQKEAADQQRHIRKVIGTDEFHEHVDDDAFTNHLAAWTLKTAARLAQQLKQQDPALYSSSLELWNIGSQPEDRWLEAANEIADPFVAAADGIVEQFAGYFSLIDPAITEWDCNGMPIWPEGLDLSRLNETRLLKQPDVVQVFALLPDEFDKAFMLRNYDYYEQRTMHKSSLSPSIHAMIGVRLGQTTKAYDYFMKTVCTDLDDNQGNVALGFHAASAGGAWQAAVSGFGGFSIKHDSQGKALPSFDPWLPPQWTGLEYTIKWQGADIQVCIKQNEIKINCLRTMEAIVQGKKHYIGPLD